MFKKEKIKPKDSLLQPHKETTLEKAEAKRDKRREMLIKEFNKVRKDPF